MLPRTDKDSTMAHRHISTRQFFLDLIEDYEPELTFRGQSPQPMQPANTRGSLDRAGMIEIDLPSGARLRVDAFVSEKALRRVLQAMKGAM